MRSLFILNPAAGAASKWKRFERDRRPEPGDDLVRTERRGHAADLAREAVRSGFDRVVAVGGDGTLSETVDGLLSAGSVPAGFSLAHLPAGSGCDVARHFGLPMDPGNWNRMFEYGEVRRIDAGRASWREDRRERVRHFVNIAMAGLPGDIVAAMEKTGKPLGGTLSYLGVSLAKLLGSQARAMDVEFDGCLEAKGRFHLLALALTSTTGGGMRIAPGADARDGAFDWVAVGDVGRGRLLWNFPKIYAGTHLAVAGITSGRTRSVSVHSPEEVPLNIDGEPLGILPARFEVLPEALPFLLP